MKALQMLAALWIALNLTSCMAVSYPQAIRPLDPAATIRGMQMAVNGLPGTYALMDSAGGIVLGWPQGLRYAWVAFNTGGQFEAGLKTLCGNKACPELAAELVTWLEHNGWQQVPAGMVPAGIVSTIHQLAYILSIGASLPIIPIFMIPIELDPGKVINPGVGA